MYINSISYSITNLGPGKRVVLWVTGCSLKCRGCMAVSMQKRNEANKKTVHDVFSAIKKGEHGLDGITISGGEPFEQAESVYELAKLIKKDTHLDIMVYSGYTIEEIRKHGEAANKMLEEIDILIDGRFEESNTNKKLWRGSDNQRFHILSKRAEKYSFCANMEYSGKRELHFEIIHDNSFKIIGIPERGFFENLYDRFNKVGLALRKH
jgi:anaerobic ribonucleoside-triphosphate reductase activating protein